MNPRPKKILIIQTAFLGDVILATSAIESIHASLPGTELHFLLRKGNESLLEGHPLLKKVWVLDKGNKWKNTWKMIRAIRKESFGLVLNFQRFMTSGLLAAFSGAREIRGFAKNPLSFLFTRKYPHEINADGKIHEIQRNHIMFSDLAPELKNPRLYPQTRHQAEIPVPDQPYICIAPASVWFTKQWPSDKWIEFLDNIREEFTVCLLGAPGDRDMTQQVISKVRNGSLKTLDLAGRLSLLGSAALMQGARMNYVNDSAPLHMASAVNAPVTSVFCSTVPAFGFTPLSEDSVVIQTSEDLSCRPCGLHGYRSCPEGHFRCALTIPASKLTDRLK